MLQVNDAVVRHAGSATTAAGSDFVLYHTTRNQLWTFLKAMPAPLLVALLPVHAVMLAAKWLSAAQQGRGHVVARALCDAAMGVRTVLGKRVALQRRRSASTLAVIAALTWSLAAFRQRAGPSHAVAQQ